jgi:hypothetical protein
VICYLGAFANAGEISVLTPDGALYTATMKQRTLTPPSLWALSVVDPPGAFAAMHDGTATQESHTFPCEFDVGCTDPALAVVAIRFTAILPEGGFGVCTIHGWEFSVLSGEEAEFVLEPDETKAGAVHTVRVQMPLDAHTIRFQNIGIHCVPIGMCGRSNEDKEAGILDTREKNCDAKVALLRRVMLAFGGCIADEQQIRALIEIMYTDVALSELARGILARLDNDQETIERIWGTVLGSYPVQPELVTRAWYDLALLPRGVRRSAEAKMWKALMESEDASGIGTLIAAVT